MSNERWESPFPHTIAYSLFKKHFTEINQIYWAFVPASNTIKSHAKKEAIKNNDPKSFFLVRDEDDRRIAPTYEDWKIDYAEYSNYTRMNIVMLLSSCLETYLRTIISLAFESKPGVIIRCPDSVDGVKLLRSSLSYGNCNDSQYQFTDQINDICVGEWSKRFMNFEKYFGKLPSDITQNTEELDKFRVLRNNIAHYFGREKRDYEAPLLFEVKPATRVAHERIIKFFKLVHSFASQIDTYLKENYIGAYDIIKLFYQHYNSSSFMVSEVDTAAKALQRLLGHYGYTKVKNRYFENLIDYCGVPESQSAGMYNKQSAIRHLHQIFKERKANLNRKMIGRSEFNKYIAEFNCKSDERLCVLNLASQNANEYLYSEKLIHEMANYFIKQHGKATRKHKKE